MWDQYQGSRKNKEKSCRHEPPAPEKRFEQPAVERITLSKSRSKRVLFCSSTVRLIKSVASIGVSVMATARLMLTMPAMNQDRFSEKQRGQAGHEQKWNEQCQKRRIGERDGQSRLQTWPVWRFLPESRSFSS